MCVERWITFACGNHQPRGSRSQRYIKCDIARADRIPAHECLDITKKFEQSVKRCREVLKGIREDLICDRCIADHEEYLVGFREREQDRMDRVARGRERERERNDPGPRIQTWTSREDYEMDMMYRRFNRRLGYDYVPGGGW